MTSIAFGLGIMLGAAATLAAYLLLRNRQEF